MNRRCVLVYGVLPGLALVLAMAAGLLKWQAWSVPADDAMRAESVQAAKESTIVMLSYGPDTVEQDVNAARDRLTDGFREHYLQVTRDAMIPATREKQITAVASVPAAAPVSVSVAGDHAVVLEFVDQVVTVGSAAPADTVSSFRVALDKVGGRWLISAFDPV